MAVLTLTWTVNGELCTESCLHSLKPRIYVETYVPFMA